MTEATPKLNEPQPADWPHEKISLLECIVLNDLALLFTEGTPVSYIAKGCESALAPSSADVVFRGEPVKLYFSMHGEERENISAGLLLEAAQNPPVEQGVPVRPVGDAYIFLRELPDLPCVKLPGDPMWDDWGGGEYRATLEDSPLSEAEWYLVLVPDDPEEDGRFSWVLAAPKQSTVVWAKTILLG